MLTLEQNEIQVQLDSQQFTIKAPAIKNYENFMASFQAVMRYQLEYDFSLAKMLADKKCCGEINKVLKLLRIDSEIVLTVEVFEDDLNILSELICGKAKQGYENLQSGYWAWAYPDTNKILQQILSMGNAQQITDEVFLREMISKAANVDMMTVFEPPALCILVHANWYTDFLHVAQEMTENKKKTKELTIDPYPSLNSQDERFTSKS